jgi:hypothetical protein
MRYSKTAKLILQLFLLFTIVFTLSGCGGTDITIKNTAVPITINQDDCRSVSVANIITNIPEETEIGSYHSGCLNIPGHSNTAIVLTGFENKIAKEVEKELTEANYNIVGTKNSLFEDNKISSDLLIGGNIVECKYDTYDSVCGVYSESTVTVNWKIKDQTTDSIIYDKITVGAAESPGNHPNAIAYAVRGSFKDILADPIFVDAVLK